MRRRPATATTPVGSGCLNPMANESQEPPQPKTQGPQSQCEPYVPNTDDPGWKYGFLPNKQEPGRVKCKLCPKLISSGINRFNKHIAHIKGDAAPCPNSDAEAKKLCKEHLDGIKTKKEDAAKAAEEERAEVDIYGEKEDEILEIGSKRKQTRGPMDRYKLTRLHLETVRRETIHRKASRILLSRKRGKM